MTVSPRWLDVALREVGVKEIRGGKHSTRVLQYFAAARSNVHDDETAWCSAFMNFVFAQCHIKPTYNLSARSWLTWGKASSLPVPGAVAIWPRGNAWQGHVNMVVRVVNNTFVDCVGGNQYDPASGGAVNIHRYKISGALGFRVPLTATNSNTVRAATAGFMSTGLGTATDAGQNLPADAKETITGVMVDTLGETQGFVDQAAMYLDWFKFVAFGLALLCFGIVAYRRIQSLKHEGNPDA